MLFRSAMEYDAAYPKFVTTASTSAKDEAEVEFEEDDQFDNADDDITEEEVTEAPHELTDVSEKLEKLFNIDTENKE